MVEVKTQCRRCGEAIERRFETERDANAFTEQKPILCNTCKEAVQ